MAQNKWISLLTDAARAILGALGGSSRAGGTSGSGPGTSRKPSGPTASGTPRGVAPRPRTGATASGTRAPKPGPQAGGRGSGSPAGPASARGPRPTGSYPGDFTGRVRAEYSPQLDGDPDPGEIVWTWVPYEEDFSQGKDRPVLLVGRDGGWLLATMLSSKDHSRDAADEARWGRHWLDIGSGPWDSRGRDSEVRLDRVIRVDPGAVRREGAVMDRRTFETIVREMGRIQG
ncbi:type II toxin-antitoxin system PemK/MazF family toxin [Oerskovia gallyi]|uniref:Type II toxin-antitoxin system PemK/MazF family toxin n=1 Tax=Oerskovia gallyi TaxID=2762226 RepID=A0ABR8UXH8_9CELL|nr:type II toxin-antitoxin system PemK/MazF family toxin [Oerskovia gallyi]MBD7997240.1 type II toxin-antitoxin system PemK/MazF family toxin [Oerskovia gallyi]